MSPFFRAIKNALKGLSATPLHPQWLSRAGGRGLKRMLQSIPAGSVVLDIGCFDKWPRQSLAEGCTYIGMDYPETALNWYGSKPDVFGDAAALPVGTSSMDAVLLLDVLEHLEDGDMAMGEISRVLKKGGVLILQVPFLYPLHDEPRDYRRITSHGFGKLARDFGYQLISLQAVGRPIETSGLLVNIALARQIMTWMSRKNPLMLLVVVYPLLILLINLSSRLLAALAGKDQIMPFSYQVFLRKN